jgi:uncharacterized membrane protein (DUF4010 family)
VGAVGRLPDLAPLALALAIGLLIGLERGWRTRGAEAGTRVAGFCTFGLLGLLGGLGAVLPGKPGLALLAAAAALVVAGYVRAAADPHTRSATAALAGLLTIGLGYLAASGQGVEALAAAAGVTLVLASRERVHGAIRGISATEIEAVGRFAIVALVILPLMPDRGLGPYASLNPRQLWFVVVLVLGLNFAGNAAARRLGAGKGLLVTAAAGALVSSTAVTLAYARRLKAPDAPATALAAGISLASLLLFARVLILTAILAGFALPGLARIVVPALFVQGAILGLMFRRAPHGVAETEVALGNPLDFRPALVLAGLIALFSFAGHWALERFGGLGAGALLTLTGMMDVDAAIIALGTFPEGVLAPLVAGTLLSLPVLANTLWKAGLSVAIAGRAGWRAAWPLVASAGAGGLVLAVLAIRGIG